MLGLNQVDPTYARVRSSIRGLILLLEAQAHPATHEDPEIDPRTGEVAEDTSDGDPPLVRLDELACALLNAAIPETVPTTGAMAIDIPPINAPPVPHLARGLVLRPANHANASIRGHHANINRGYIRVVGLAPVTTLLAFGLAGMNTRILNVWYTSRGQPEPWATIFGEPPDERVPQREHRRYRPKRGSPPTTPGGHTTKKRRTAHTT